MQDSEIVQCLHEIAEQEVPAHVDLWPAIRAQITVPQRLSLGTRLKPTTRWSWGLAVLGIFLIMGGISYALGPVISRIFEMIPSWQHLEESQLVQDLHLSQTVEGVTVTLEAAYADANQILIGYRVSGLTDPRAHIGEMVLTDQEGTEFEGTTGVGVTGTSDLLKVRLSEGERSYVFAFDGSAVQGTPSHLQLHLEMHLSQWIPLTPTQVASAAYELPSNSSTTVVLQPMMLREGPTLGKPFVFDFSVPFIPGRVANVQQTARAAGVVVELEQVVVTPSETRVALCLDLPEGPYEAWSPIATLYTESGQSYDVTYERVKDGKQNDGRICSHLGLLASLYNDPGEWTLVVTELVGFDRDPPYEQTRLSGPWTFRFQVP